MFTGQALCLPHNVSNSKTDLFFVGIFQTQYVNDNCKFQKDGDGAKCFYIS